jgi:hypothetical protein
MGKGVAMRIYRDGVGCGYYVLMATAMRQNGAEMQKTSHLNNDVDDY